MWCGLRLAICVFVLLFIMLSLININLHLINSLLIKSERKMLEKFYAKLESIFFSPHSIRMHKLDIKIFLSYILIFNSMKIYDHRWIVDRYSDSS